jgi:hypothetical protein
MTGKCKGSPVSSQEYDNYYEHELKVKLEPKFKNLSSLISDFLREHFQIDLKYEFPAVSEFVSQNWV